MTTKKKSKSIFKRRMFFDKKNVGLSRQINVLEEEDVTGWLVVTAAAAAAATSSRHVYKIQNFCCRSVKGKSSEHNQSSRMQDPVSSAQKKKKILLQCGVCTL